MVFKNYIANPQVPSKNEINKKFNKPI